MSNGCLLWSGATDHNGYGIIYTSTQHPTQRLFLAHRVAWTLTNGSVPEGICVLHSCDRPLCINPDHLFLGRQLDNIEDMVFKNRSPNRKLTPNQVRSIRKLYKTGRYSQEMLATYYRVDQTCISCIVRYKTYYNVE